MSWIFNDILVEKWRLSFQLVLYLMELLEEVIALSHQTFIEPYWTMFFLPGI